MPRDVNGNPIEVSRWKRWSGRLAGGRKSNGELSADDPSLVVTAESFDDAKAASYADRVIFLRDGNIVDELRNPDMDTILRDMSGMED